MEVSQFKNSTLRIILVLAVLFLAILTSSSNATIMVYIGSNDGSPYHVPYQGVVDIPVWIDDIYNATSADIVLTTPNFAVSERLGGNFYFPWWYAFSDPWYSQYVSRQSLFFVSSGWLDSLSHLADFTVRMDIDTSYVSDTLSIMYARAIFFDSTGYDIYDYQMHISQVVIDEITSIESEKVYPENMILSSAYPNPFNASTTIKYSLPKTSDVSLTIYDIRGRAVKIIYRESVPAGENSIAWNGADNTGGKVSSGVYLYRITAGGYEATSRVTLLK